MGYKASTFRDAGYFYAPYLPLQSSPTVTLPPGFGVYGYSFEQIEERAYFMWEADEEKKVPEYYWTNAQAEMVHPLAIALAEEGGFTFKPGSTMFPYHYSIFDIPFAHARIEEDRFVISSKRIFGSGIEKFDLNDPDSIPQILSLLKTLVEHTIQDGIPEDEPDPGGFSTRKGILTRYGKKLLQEGKKYYVVKGVMDLT